MAKTAANLSGIHAVNSLQSVGMRSIPASPKSAFLDLFVLQNQQDRLAKEKSLLRMRRRQIDKRLSSIRKNMGKLLKTAVTAAKEGKAGNDGLGGVFKKHGKSIVLGY